MLLLELFIHKINLLVKVSNLIIGYTSLMNEVNILKKFRNLDVNGICNESDDVLLIEMVKVLNDLLTINSITKK